MRDDLSEIIMVDHMQIDHYLRYYSDVLTTHLEIFKREWEQSYFKGFL